MAKDIADRLENIDPDIRSYLKALGLENFDDEAAEFFMNLLHRYSFISGPDLAATFKDDAEAMYKIARAIEDHAVTLYGSSFKFDGMMSDARAFYRMSAERGYQPAIEWLEGLNSPDDEDEEDDEIPDKHTAFDRLLDRAFSVKEVSSVPDSYFLEKLSFDDKVILQYMIERYRKHAGEKILSAAFNGDVNAASSAAYVMEMQANGEYGPVDESDAEEMMQDALYMYAKAADLGDEEARKKLSEADPDMIPRADQSYYASRDLLEEAAEISEADEEEPEKKTEKAVFDPAGLSETDKDLYLSITEGTYSIPRFFVEKAFSGDGEAAGLIADNIDYQIRALYDDDDASSHTKEMQDYRAMLKKAADLGYAPAKEKLDRLHAEETDDHPFAEYGLEELSSEQKDRFRYIKTEYPSVSADDLAAALKGDGEAAFRVAAAIEEVYDTSPYEFNSDVIMDDAYVFYKLAYENGCERAATWLEAFDPDFEKKPLPSPAEDASKEENSSWGEGIRNISLYGPVEDSVGLDELNTHDYDLFNRVRNNYSFVSEDLLAALRKGDAEAAYNIAVLIDREADAAAKAGDNERAGSLKEDAYSMYEISSDGGYGPARQIVPEFHPFDMHDLFEDPKAFKEFIRLEMTKRFRRGKLINAVSGAGKGSASDAYEIAEGLTEQFQRPFYPNLVNTLYFRAADMDYVPAYSRAANLILSQSYFATKEETESAVRWARKGADIGDPDSIYMLAELSRSEKFRSLVPEDSFDLYLRAAEKGSADAMFVLYELYEEGGAEDLKGKPPVRNYRKAKEWLLKAQAAGLTGEDTVFYRDLDSYIEDLDEQLAREEEEDKDSSIASLRKKALNGDAKAQAELGSFYFNNYGLIEEDYSEAKYWLGLAAEKGIAQAQRELGQCYLEEPSYDKLTNDPYKWIQASADQGYGPALFDLGSYYYYRKSSDPEDAENAAEYFRRAASAGYPAAEYYLGRCYLNGKGVTASLADAVTHLQKAQKQGEKVLPYVTPDEVRKALDEAEKRLKEYRKSMRPSLRNIWEDCSFQILGILGSAGMYLFTKFYEALGAGLSGPRTIPVHGLLWFVMMLVSIAGMFACTYLAIASLLMPVGLDFLASYPTFCLPLAIILNLRRHPEIFRYIIYAGGAIIAINLLIIFFSSVLPRLTGKR